MGQQPKAQPTCEHTLTLTALYGERRHRVFSSVGPPVGSPLLSQLSVNMTQVDRQHHRRQHHHRQHHHRQHHHCQHHHRQHHHQHHRQQNISTSLASYHFYI